MAKEAIGQMVIVVWQENGIIGSDAQVDGNVMALPKAEVAGILQDFSQQFLKAHLTEARAAEPAKKVVSAIALPPGVRLQ